ncbi:phage holin [Avibacterium paragallinarum]|uniref:Phage holin family protein n=1 Tax=Avibacterium paragallinarum TaxID=728 RepID=A0A0F5ESA5_AVIPA|nr:phage holin [Avibacterium paragallinarum]MEE3608256.1 phage holin [Avibacterium paragallinarum]MEE3621620.1 phage holin [Avibacterium paragallinarum]MEE3669441.1 phage holin [Avibacterium paragallinarum]MEE3680415.1 phage holin [Avibacterium paragallinarum]MEE4385926.1 phage holin [Avibacterium paragallinarum]
MFNDIINFFKTNTAPISGSVAVAFGSLSPNEAAAIASIVFGFCTIAMNFYFKHRELKLRKQEIERKYRNENEPKNKP